jgi:hypothetical protein
VAELPGQDGQYKPARIGTRREPGQNRNERTAKTEQSEKASYVVGEFSQKGTAKTGQSGPNRQNKTARTELPLQDCQHRVASTGLLRDIHSWTESRGQPEAEQDRQSRIASTGQSG